jgi:hypothetical protein
MPYSGLSTCRPCRHHVVHRQQVLVVGGCSRTVSLTVTSSDSGTVRPSACARAAAAASSSPAMSGSAAHRHRTWSAVVQIGGRSPAEAGAQRGHDLRLLRTPASPPCAGRPAAAARGAGDAAVVDVDDAVGALEHLAHRLATARAARPRRGRRPRPPAAPAPAGRAAPRPPSRWRRGARRSLQRRAHRAWRWRGSALALVLVDQVDLQVAHCRRRAGSTGAPGR